MRANRKKITTTVYLEEDQKRQLAKLALDLGVTEAAIYRVALRRALGNPNSFKKEIQSEHFMARQTHLRSEEYKQARILKLKQQLEHLGAL
jgi:hypothetical protein